MIIFKPKYDKGLVFAYIFFPVVLYILGPDVFKNPLGNPILTFSYFIISFMLIAGLFIFYKKIVFYDDFFIVHYFLGMDRKIYYFDIVDMGSLNIKTRKGSLVINSIKNSGELINLLMPRIGEIKGELLEAEKHIPLLAIASAVFLINVPLALYFVPIDYKWKPLLSIIIISLLILITSKAVYRKGR